MKLFLCGGGDGKQTIDAYSKLNSIIDHNKPLLYIPLAMEEDKYDSCYEWITNELKFMNINIKMVRSFQELESLNYFDYSCIFIGGGNTYKLLDGLKSSKCFVKIQEYLMNDGIIFGGSAGTIIFGYDLEACKLDDSNDVYLIDHKGFNVLDDYSILCHFTNRDSEHDKKNNDYLLSISDNRKCLAIPEEDTLYIHDGDIEIIGNRDFYLFLNGKRIKVNSSNFNKYKNSILKRKVKNIVFDMGSVILSGIPSDVLFDKNIDNDTYNQLIKYFNNISEADYGKVSLNDIFDKCNFSDYIKDNYRDLLVNYFEYRKINNNLIDLIDKLKKYNYGIYILSDNNKEAYNYYSKDLRFKNIDGWIVSSFYGCLKKDEKLFDIFLDEYNLNSSDCYFIDDNIKNIEIAKRKGFNTFLFCENDDINKLLFDMYNHGVDEIYEK